MPKAKSRNTSARRRHNPFSAKRTTLARRRRNPHTFLARTARRRNPNVLGFDLMELTKGGIGAAAGAFVVPYAVQKILHGKNEGWMGYGATIALGIGGGALIAKMGQKAPGYGFALGTLGSAIKRLVDETWGTASVLLSQVQNVGDPHLIGVNGSGLQGYVRRARSLGSVYAQQDQYLPAVSSSAPAPMPAGISGMRRHRR